MALFCADENFDFPVSEKLRARGHDVLTVQEAGERGGDDARVLAYAVATGRVVLTFDRNDFDRLHRANPGHAGIVSCTWDPDADALAARIDQAITGVGTLSGRPIRVNRLT